MTDKKYTSRDIELRAIAYQAEVTPPYDVEDVITAYEKGFIDGQDAAKIDIKSQDIWETRRYELVKEQVLNNGATISYAITIADEMISKLKALTY